MVQLEEVGVDGIRKEKEREETNKETVHIFCYSLSFPLTPTKTNTMH